MGRWRTGGFRRAACGLAAAAAFFGRGAVACRSGAWAGGISRTGRAGRWRGGFGLARLAARGALLLGAGLGDEVFAHALARLGELRPPVGQHFGHFAIGGAQLQKVQPGAKARLLCQGVAAGAGAFFKARLHHPDFAHVGGQPAPAGYVADAGVKHFINGRLQGGMRVFALRGALLPEGAHVLPEQAGEQEAGGDGLAFGHAAVGVLQGGSHERLLRALHGQIQQGVDALGQAEFFELLHAGLAVAGLQQLEHFVKQAALGHVGQQALEGGKRAAGFGVELEAQVRELGGKARGADDAHGVFAVARGGVANHAQHALLRVGKAVVVVHHDLALRVVVHGVDAEVAPGGVFVLRPPHVVAQHAAGGIHGVFHARKLAFGGALVAADVLGVGAVQVGAEGGDFDHFVLAPAPEDHVHDAKAPPDDEGAPEQRLDLLGRGVGGHVKVFGAQAQQQVAHGAADDVGLVPRVFERADHADGAAIDQRQVNAVRGRADFHALAKAAFAAAREFVEQFANHGCAPNSSSTGQPRSSAMGRRRASGLAATGRCTFSSRGKSLMESL